MSCSIRFALLASKVVSLVVVLGCVITVLCVALDPFGQQVLLYQTRPVAAGTASVASATSYGETSNDTCESLVSL